MATRNTSYDEEFFRDMAADAGRAARRVVPVLVEALKPHSVVDVGCGTGSWLAEFERRGVLDIFGIDGAWVPQTALQVPEKCFRQAELAEPLAIERRFDLVISLEVAEHLPAGAAGAFVEFLTKLGPVVVFSAAVPHQGGVDHVNEQWPDYWVRLFAGQGFQAFDPLRFLFWSDPDVAWYYAQNMLVFVAGPEVERHRPALEWLATRRTAIPALVHPQRYLMTPALSTAGLRDLLSALPSAFGAAVRRRLPR